MEIIRLTDRNFAETVKKAAAVLKQGGVVLYPTDTLYGLAVDARSVPALERLRTLKGRERKKPISIVVPEVAHIEAYAELEASPRYYAKRFLPGALTLVLTGKEGALPKELMLNGTVGVRVPSDRFALAFADAFGGPITATSANRAGLPTFPEPRAILQQFGSLAQELVLIVDDGPREAAPGSTVLAFRDGDAHVLREGALSRRQLGL